MTFAMRIILGAALLALLGFGQSASCQVVIYKGAALIDGTGAPVRRNVAITVRGERIESIQAATELPVTLPDGSEVVDVSGQYVLPGLIDTHVHLATTPNRRRAEAHARRYLYSGVTAVRDMAGDARALAELARSAAQNEIAAPDIYYSAVMAGPSFFSDPRTVSSARGFASGTAPWLQAVTDSTDLRIAVALARGTAATGIKLYANLPGPLVKKVTAEAHRQGIRVWTHATIFPASPLEIIDAAPDVISHVCFLAYQLMDPIPDQFQNSRGADPRSISPDDPIFARIFKGFLEKNIILDATTLGCPGLGVALTRQAHRVGVAISTGTDRVAPPEDLFSALHQELQALADQAGMPAMDVIRAATFVGARTIGREQDMGTLEPGKLANMVFVAKNPLEGIGNLKSVVLTVKRGTRYPRSGYRPITSEEVATPASPAAPSAHR